MHLAKNVQLQGMRLRCQLAQLQIAQSGSDQQNGIGPVGPRFQELEFIHHKVFPQAGQIAGLRSHLQIAQTSLKKMLFGKHREGRGACRLRTAAAREATSKSGRINPREGDAFFSSAITAGPCKAFCRSARANPRGRWALAACSRSGPEDATLRSSTPRRVTARIFVSWLSICLWLSTRTISICRTPCLHRPSPLQASNQWRMNHFPSLWVESAEAAVSGRRLQSAPRSVLMLDYDGTLAPFQIDRFEASPYPGVEDRLAILSGLSRVRLVLITGRSARELGICSPPPSESKSGAAMGGSSSMPMGPMNWPRLNRCSRTRCEEVRQQLLGLGFAAALEMKPSSLAVHWRSLEPGAKEQLRSLTRIRLRAPCQPASGLQLLPFDGGFELRSTDRTKGTAVRQILAPGTGRAPAGLPGR